MKQSKVVKILDTKTFNERQQKDHESGKVHTYNVEYFLEYDSEAVALQLSNLVNTYGQELVTKQLSALKRKLKTNVKKKKAA